ncbi:hypothetical protein FG379_002134 [Cryptosporidium bovis]|uniref:uncharacterized protein n=1 Tax=Cryptosporidium bovis TaxID=310047 RepID=UPI00351A8DC7|nr:hypothetical protein FG379_002134 [Cryptosporidium bovis]
MRFRLFTLSALLFGLLYGLLSVSCSSNLRSVALGDALTVDPELFGGHSVRKVEIRSPISGILKTVNISSTGYYSAGTAFVVTATENQYYKSAITANGKSVSVKRVVESGRNVYIQIFRECYVVFHTSKNPGDAVRQFDLLAISYVKRTQPGESPIVQKLPRSIPTTPITLSSPSSTTDEVAEERDLDGTVESKETELTDDNTSSADNTPQDQEDDGSFEATSSGIESSEAEAMHEVQDQVSLTSSQLSNDQVSVEDGQTSELLTENQDLDQIPEKTEIIASDISTNETQDSFNRGLSEVSDFVSDSEDSSRSSSTTSNSENNDATIGSIEILDSTAGISVDDGAGIDATNMAEGVPLGTETTLVDISESSVSVPEKRDQSTQTEDFDPTITAVEEAMTITTLSTSIPVEDKSTESDSEVSSEVESQTAESGSNAVGTEPSTDVTTIVTETTSESAMSSPIPSEVEEEEASGIPEKPIIDGGVDEQKVDEFDGLDTDSSAGGVGSADGEKDESDGSLNSAGRVIASDIDNSGSNSEQ